MQLSLPVSTFPAPAAPNNGSGKNSAVPGTPADQPETSAECFDSFFPKSLQSEEPESDEPGSNGEQAASMMAAAFWMPIAPVANAPQLPSTLLESAPVEETSSSETDSSNLSPDLKVGNDALGIRPFFAPTSSRALTSFASSKPSDESSQKTCTPAVLPDLPAERQPVQSTANEVIASSPVVMAANETVIASIATPVTQKQFGMPVPKAAGDAVKNAIKKTDTTSVDLPETEATDLSNPVKAVVREFFSGDFEKKAAAAIPAVVENLKEKIAALPQAVDEAVKNLKEGAERYFLNPVQKAVTATSASVGISVAKVNATMSAATPARTKSASINESTTSFVYSAEQAPVATLTLDAPAPVATVRETMAAVISAVDALERRADVQQKSVDLQFNVGSEKLGLRVELRDGTVHTTFRTESAEMNGALTREWHAVVQPGLGREVRLAEPVFSSAPSANNYVQAASGDSASTAFGHGAHQQQEQQQKAPQSFSSALKREFYDPVVTESAPATSPVANSSQILNALA
jgi:hypothetical protein